MRALPFIIAAALLLPGGSPPVADAQGLLTFGIGGDRFPVGAEDWDDALQRVLDNDVPTRGSEILILPGTYPFDEPVQITGCGRKLVGWGATIVAAGTATLFDVSGPECQFEGLRLESSPQPIPQLLVRVTSQNFRMRDCTLARKSSFTPEPEAAVTLVSLEAGHKDAEITGNLFRFGECYTVDGSGVRSRHACAQRNIGLSARLGSGLRLNSNAFRPDDWNYTDTTGTHAAGGDVFDAVQFRGETNITVASNTFIGLNSINPANALIWAGEENFVATRGLLVFANFFENPSVRHSVVLEGVQDASITGNILGRSQGGFRLTAGASTAKGRGIEIWGNQLHNLGNFDGQFAALQVSGQDTLAIQHNQFTLCGRTQVQIAADVRAVMLVGNHFMLDNPNGTDACTAIDIDLDSQSPGGHQVAENSGIGSPLGRERWCQIVRISRLCRDKVNVANNWTDRLVGCSPTPSCPPALAICD